MLNIDKLVEESQGILDTMPDEEFKEIVNDDDYKAICGVVFNSDFEYVLKESCGK